MSDEDFNEEVRMAFYSTLNPVEMVMALTQRVASESFAAGERAGIEKALKAVSDECVTCTNIIYRLIQTVTGGEK